MDKEGHKSIESNKAYEELELEEEDLEEHVDLDLDDDDEENQDHLKFEFEKREDDEHDEQDDDDNDDYDDDDDDDEDDDDEVDEKVARLLPKETMIDVYSGETVDGVEVGSNKRKREEEEVELELDDDDNDDDFEQVEEMIFPVVVKKIENGKTAYEMEVAVIKDDDFIDDSLYRDDFEPTDTKKDFAEALYFRPPKIQAKAPDVCPICFKHWTSHYKHRVCCLPCGHIFGASCIKKWLQTDLRSTRKNVGLSLSGNGAHLILD